MIDYVKENYKECGYAEKGKCTEHVANIGKKKNPNCPFKKEDRRKCWSFKHERL